jgi:two-component system, cell cycle response regulator DivK
LVIEDNRLNMKLFHDLLTTAGYTLITATSAQEGLDLAKRHLPDLIVVDLQLPDGSGLDLIRAIRDAALLNSTPVVATSAFQSFADERWMSAHRCDAFIAKPISGKKFLAALAQLLGSRTASGEGSPDVPDAAPNFADKSEVVSSDVE